MFNIGSDEVKANNTNETKEDSTLEFRKCWDLGAAYYYLAKDSIYKNEFSKEDIFYLCMFYKSQIDTIQSICESLEIKSTSLTTTLNKIREEVYKKRFPDFIENFNFLNLQYLLIAKLKGKEPRYQDIFRTAKHCQSLYNDDTETNRRKLLDDLDSLSNFVSKNKRDIIKKLLNSDEWTRIKEKYKYCKLNEYREKGYINQDEWKGMVEKYRDNKSNEYIEKGYINQDEWKGMVEKYRDIKSDYIEKGYLDKDKWETIVTDKDIKLDDIYKSAIDRCIKPRGKIEIVEKIAGLILGTVQISELLTKEDRAIWVILVYVVFGLLIISTTGIILMFFYYLYKGLLTFLFNNNTNNIINATNLVSGQNLPSIITAVVALITALIPAFSSAIVLFKKWANYVELKLATQRLKDPIKGWRTGLVVWLKS